MSKRRISLFAVSTKDWMQFRPYEQFAPGYDSYYLKLANQIFEVLNQPESFLRELLPREEIIELSVILSSWFEDFANEIGIWSAYTRKNKDLHGFYIPFYPLQDYDPDEINVEDLAYLVWHYASLNTQKIISPNSPAILNFGEILANMFEEALEDAPGTDFYDKYLQLPDDIYFFQLKAKLHWMTFKNYLTGPDFKHDLEVQIEEIQSEKDGLLDYYKDLGTLIYTLQDDYLYKRNNTFLALTMPEWLAEVARCSEYMRNDIRGLTRRVPGEFVFESENAEAYQFRHFHTKRLFQVASASVTMKGIATGSVIFTTLIKWKTNWWVTGSLASLGEPGSVPKRTKGNFDPNLITYYAYSEEQQQALKESAQEMEQAFLDFFGERLLFFKNKQTLQEALEAQSAYYNARKTKDGKPGKLDPKLRAKFATQLDKALKDTPPDGKGLGLFYEPGEGAMISPILPEIVHRLTMESPSTKDINSLFIALFTECSPPCFQYLLEKYGAKNLQYPIRHFFELSKHYNYLLRFYNPDGFREVLPNTSFLLTD